MSSTPFGLAHACVEASPPDDRSLLPRTLRVLDACLQTAEAVPLPALTETVGLPKSTTWRIAESLVRSGLLARTEDGYRGGAGLIERGRRAAAQGSLQALALPELSELQQRTATAVWLVDIRDDTEWAVIVSLYGKSVASSRYRDDWPHSPRDPAVLASAFGKIALANRPDAARSLLSRGVPRLTPQTDIEPRRIETALRRAGETGEVIEHGGFLRGWSCLAVPVMDARAQRAAAVLGVVDRTPRFVPSRLLPAARSTAASLQRTWALAPPS